MSMHPAMDMWRYKIVGYQNPQFDEETEFRTPAFNFESEIFWEKDTAEMALADMKALLPKADIHIQRTRDRWEDVR